MSKTVKKICPVTGLDEITVTYPDPEELVMTQRKIDGKYKRVLKPRKQVANALKPTFSCPQLEYPFMADLPKSLADQMENEERVWCNRIKKPCPTDQVFEASFDSRSE